jgi:hypothetical protein
MKYLNKDYVVQEILDIIRLQQESGISIPELSSDRIGQIADSILFEWNEIGDPDANLEQFITWNLEQNLSHA